MVDLLDALWTFVEGLVWLSFLGEGKSQAGAQSQRRASAMTLEDSGF
jgi:hypothetical protein